MKKILLTLISVMAALALSSCMGGGTTTADTAPASVKANEAFAMTAEKAAGTYALESMDNIGDTNKDSYEINTITLGEDGSFEFNVQVGKMNDNETGTYSIGANGVITFSAEEDDFAIVARNETVVCDGAKLTAEGKLGRAVITMNYAKRAEAPAEETSAETEPAE